MSKGSLETATERHTSDSNLNPDVYQREDGEEMDGSDAHDLSVCSSLSFRNLRIHWAGFLASVS